MKAKKKRKKSELPRVQIEGMKNPTLLSRELIDQIEKFYRMGLKDAAVANMVGVSRVTLAEWLVRGAAFDTGLFGELFKRCAKAVGSSELEYVAKLREHAMGSPAEFAFEYTYHPDGSIASKKIQLDSKNQPIVIKEEIKSNAVWLSWFLERRFGKVWGRNDQTELGGSTPDLGFQDAGLHKKGEDLSTSKIPVQMTYEERQEMFDRIKKKMDDEHKRSLEKEVNPDHE